MEKNISQKLEPGRPALGGSGVGMTGSYVQEPLSTVANLLKLLADILIQPSTGGAGGGGGGGDRHISSITLKKKFGGA